MEVPGNTLPARKQCKMPTVTCACVTGYGLGECTTGELHYMIIADNQQRYMEYGTRKKKNNTHSSG